MPEPVMRAEIERYIAVPGQRLGTWSAQCEILRLRDDTRSRLGPAWDIRDFHAAVLDHGSLPLVVLPQVVEDWVTSAAARDGVQADACRRPPPHPCAHLWI
ncbi:MAG TPA: DUF885 family protein [Actinomycetes bacterium]|jgi:uncharacterized protein (DUF885 family)|nr:DUF885 family protein [Actinomycetes bacterium]